MPAAGAADLLALDITAEGAQPTKESRRPVEAPVRHTYAIRDARTSEPVMPDTFENLMLALDMAQALANVRRARLEIIREDESIVVTVDPEAWQEGN